MNTSIPQLLKAGLLVAVFSFSTALMLMAQPYHVSVNVVNNATPVKLPPNFNGFASNEAKTTWQYDDPLFLNATQSLYPKMIRWPGGASSKYDWRTGDIPTAFIERSIELNLDDSADVSDDYKGQAINRSKGGTSLLDLSNLVLAPNNAMAIVTLNSLTDIPQFPTTDYAGSARDLAIYVRDNNIRVAYFDLMNEPYLKKQIDFFLIIADQLGMEQKEGEHLGHFTGRVYVAWVKLFNDAIKAEMPDAKTAVMFGPGKSVSVTYNDQTDDDYNNHFNEAIWDYSKNNKAFWDAISFHWYQGASQKGDPKADTRDVLAGDVPFLEELVRDYFIAGNEFYSGDADMPILISETNVSSTSNLIGSLYSAVFVSELLITMSKFPQVKNVDIQSLAPNSALSWGSFKLKKTFSWQSIAYDAYQSTPDSILPSVIPYANKGLLSFTTYPDIDRQSGLLSLNMVSTLPNATTDPNLKNYEVYFSAHGYAMQMINRGLLHAQLSYDVEVTDGSMASVTYGKQPNSPIETEIGKSITEGPALAMRAFRDGDGTGRLVVVNKSAEEHSIDVSWAGELYTGEIIHDWISGTDYTAENTDLNQELITPHSESVTGQVTIGPYSVNVLKLGKFPRYRKVITAEPFKKAGE